MYTHLNEHQLRNLILDLESARDNDTPMIFWNAIMGPHSHPKDIDLEITKLKCELVQRRSNV